MLIQLCSKLGVGRLSFPEHAIGEGALLACQGRVISLRLGGSFYGENCEIRTDDLAKVAIHALRLIRHLRRMVSFGIERLGNAQNVARTIYHAEFTPLASVFYYDNLAFAHLDVLLIQGSSPILHNNPLRWASARRIRFRLMLRNFSDSGSMLRLGNKSRFR